MNAAVSQLVLMLVIMQVSKRLDLENPDVVNYIRAAYVLSNAIIIGLYLYTRSVINKKKDLTTLKYMEPPSLFGGNGEGVLKTTTVHQYDLDQVNSALRSLLQGVAMMGFMHLYLKYTNPLISQCIMPLKSAFEQNIVKVHVYGKPATGDLKRPFKAPSMFGAMTGESGSSDASVSAAETAGKGGKIKQD